MLYPPDLFWCKFHPDVHPLPFQNLSPCTFLLPQLEHFLPPSYDGLPQEKIRLVIPLARCVESLIYDKRNRPPALRGHLTKASFKRWVGILLMPKIDRAHKNDLTPEIWEETHLREIFYGTLIFQQSSMICIGRHVGGHTLALQHGGQNYFLLISC